MLLSTWIAVSLCSPKTKSWMVTTSLYVGSVSHFDYNTYHKYFVDMRSLQASIQGLQANDYTEIPPSSCHT